MSEANPINDDDDDNGKRSIQRRLALYDKETTIILRQAYELAQHREKEEHRQQTNIGGDNRIVVLPKPRADYKGNEDVVEVSSDDEDDDENGLATIESEDENESDSENENDANKSDDEEDNNGHEKIISDTASSPIATASTKLSPSSSSKKDDNDETNNANITSTPATTATTRARTNETLHNELSLHLFPAAALLSKDNIREPVNVVHQSRSLMLLSERLSSSSAVVVILLIQSGRFAGGVFRCGRCISHRATTRYTVRKGQGKAQSAQDSSSRPKSIGSQLRRAGEQQLNEDVKMTLKEWTDSGYLDSKNCEMIFLGCPKAMRSTVYSASTDTNKNNNNSSDCLLSKNEDRIRKIPFDFGRATYDHAKLVYTVMMGVDIREVSNLTTKENDRDMGGSSEVGGTSKEIVENENYDPAEEKRIRKEELALELPLTKLHEAAKDGNLVILLDLLNNANTSTDRDNNGVIDQPAGYECMTPLHFAAASSPNVDPVTASALVSALLIQGRADPTIHDARGRPPYFIAGHDKIREAFRKARSVLGEDYCDWDGGGKVGPPLTEEDIKARKEKETEKNRKKKARQKEKKAKDKARSQEAETRREAEREAKQALEEAKRVRDGLSEKATGPNVCDFCNKVCKGRNARQNMFQRLDYKYCSSNCVNDHKRELMAAAAMARFGG
ncbi:hypothetical protein FRACYDRAFT_262317 [Fragilariopsis cylindrus CCMP1102]|uniref:VLRF1 domain-containing protein n=1 Tax=Fragilariopsis cylindrus CCMP1102 TaxID=635003 RepID=A0A1E7F5Y1_9STRA|nr:hypothetical protein FRACYDRAFT_262317 [Fragilariopsis cylindrus CCMP1102]|eukprot:OEU13601.1 hypothetical protein FRACYDRAFT_262317 [Fragilariopsis cylindrus CCMP1102]